MTGNDVGVVVIGRNEGERLIDCLGSIPVDASCVAYVDSGSTDGSLQAASRFGVSTVGLTEPFTAARARNEGFAALRKRRPDLRFVQFIDGDCKLDSCWLDTATDFIKRHDDVAIVCGRRRERDPSSVYNRLCDVEWNTPVGETNSCGGDLLVRSEAFEQVQGFNAQLIAGEEPELCLRLREAGWRIWRLHADMTYHDAGIRRFSQWWVRTVRGGYAMAEVSRLHWRSPVGIWKLELFRTIIFGGLLPALICAAAALLQPLAVAALLVYIAQVCRIGIARRAHAAEPWAYAAFVTLAKFAEFQGVVKFYWRQLRHRPIELIEYK